MKNLPAIFFLSLFLTASLIIPVHAEVLIGSAADKVLQGAEMIRYTDRSAAPNYIQLRAGMEVPYPDFEKWISHALNFSPEDDLQLYATETDKIGHTHYRLRQLYKGLPVEGSMYIVHTYNGMVYAVNGDFFAGLSATETPAIPSPAALQIAMAEVGANTYKWELPSEELFVKQLENDPLATWFPYGELAWVATDHRAINASGFRLAWKFDVFAHEPMSRQWLYVDAQNGQVLWTEDRIHTADVQATAVTGYSGTQTMTTDSTGPNSYRLREAGRGNGIETYDLNNTSNYGNAVDFTDTDNYWNNVNPQQDEIATDAHWGAEMTYDYFWLRQGRNSIDANGFKLVSYVHYNTNYTNAFWNGSYMTYGDGNGTSLTPFTAIDVTGHEIGHGLTDFSSDLVYSYESGALNESFSDIFGVLVEKQGRGTYNWRIGEDMTTSGNGIRLMSNPGSFGDPDTYLGNNWWTSSGDNGGVLTNSGVHTNSGVQNKWFYILSDGETGTNDNNDAYAVTGIGIDKAGDIAFRNNTVYLTPNSQYADARFYAIQSSIDLFGACTNEVIQTTNAWHAVGVGNVFVPVVTADFSNTSGSVCALPAGICFTNQSTNASDFDWDFGDSFSDSLISPDHSFTSAGTFTVTLIADGGACGTDTSVQTVTVDTTGPCVVVLSPLCPQGPLNLCSGTMYDSGGPTANHGNNTDIVQTIAPFGAASVSLTFSMFDLESNYDYLYIYAGPNTNSPLLGAYTGTNLPGGGTVTSNVGSITIRQYSDPGVTEAGFALTWNCTLPSAAPAVDFDADKTSTCDSTIQFKDRTLGGAINWDWDFGDGNSSTLQNPSHTYTTNGTYTVKLVATNIIGSDSLVRTSYITVNQPLVTTTPDSVCGSGLVTLGAAGNGTFNWFDSPTGGIILNSGSSYSPSITGTTTFYVEAEIPSTPEYAGPLNPAAVGGGGNHGNGTPQYLEFDAHQAITLVSAFVQANGSGNRKIYLWDYQGNILDSVTVNIPAGTGRITLNLNIPAGNGHRIGGANMNLYRNNSGPAYPYTNSSLVTITGSSAGSNYYYYLYDWEVQGPSCASPRVAVVATAIPVPSVSVTPVAPMICPGGSVSLTATGATNFNWSSGGSNASETISSGGTYYVIGDNAPGCVDTAFVTVGQFTSTANITPGGPTSFCPGDSVVLTANSGTAYLWSTGATTQSITVSSSGSFTVDVTDGNGCTVSSTPTTVSVINTPAATISPSGPITFCSGDSVTLTANTGNSYLWSNGASTQAITVNASGSFTVEVTYPGGCNSTSSNTTVTVNPLPSPTITPPGPHELCEGDSVTLTASGGDTYLWPLSGLTTPSITVDVTSSVSVIATNSFGCSATSVPVTVNVNPVPNAAFTSSTNGLTVDFTDQSTGGALIYTWDFGDGGSASTANPSHTYLAPGGTFTVTLIVTEGTCSDTITDTVTVTNVGIAENQPSGLEINGIYPNPFLDELHIRLTISESANLEVELADLLGRVYRTLAKTQVVPGEVNLDWQTEAGMAQGIYVLRIRLGNGEVVRKLVHLER